MRKKDNPFEPGAGTRPPDLAGREDLIADADAAIAKGLSGRPIRGQIFYGIRGVGKTVLLRKVSNLARDAGGLVADLETPEDKSLARLVVPELRKVVLELSPAAKARNQIERAANALHAFAAVFKVKVGDVGVEVKTPKGLADSGDLETDLADLFETVGELAASAERIVVIALDEMQYLKVRDLAALITAMHRVNQRDLPLGFFGAGLPNLLAKAGEAKSYSERLFQFVEIGALSRHHSGQAVRNPVEAAGAKINKDALAHIVSETQGYPYFLQEWGYGVWNTTEKSPITKGDVEAASDAIVRRLDRSFFRVRFDRLTPNEKLYLRGMAELGPGPHTSGDVAAILGRKVSEVATTRKRIIEKGMAYDTEYGIVAFTVPLFDEFMRREMPDLQKAIKSAASKAARERAKASAKPARKVRAKP